MKRTSKKVDSSLEYSKDIAIDENALDIEWIDQPILMFTYSNLLTKFERLVSKRKEKLNVIKSDLDKAIRENPNEYGLDKITEKAVEATILAHDDYQDVKMEIIDLQYEMSMVQNAVSALHMKKAALEGLVKLHAANYFAGPSVPRDLSKEWQNSERKKRANRQIGNHLNKE